MRRPPPRRTATPAPVACVACQYMPQGRWRSAGTAIAQLQARRRRQAVTSTATRSREGQAAFGNDSGAVHTFIVCQDTDHQCTFVCARSRAPSCTRAAASAASAASAGSGARARDSFGAGCAGQYSACTGARGAREDLMLSEVMDHTLSPEAHRLKPPRQANRRVYAQRCPRLCARSRTWAHTYGCADTRTLKPAHSCA